jgi:hypothetical protein
MTTPFRGLYRTTAWAYVTNNTMAFNVPEAEYRAFGYEPDYDSLPWKESYVAAKAGKAAQAEQTRIVVPENLVRRDSRGRAGFDRELHRESSTRKN